MTERRRRQLREKQVDIKKVQLACEHFFDYMVQAGFSLQEADELIFLTRGIIDDMTQINPQKKICDFGYSSSIRRAFEIDAKSKATS